jgi:hypothetical protein
MVHLGEKPKSYRFAVYDEIKGYLSKLGQSGMIILKWINVCGMHSSGSEQGKLAVFMNRVVDF